MERRFEVEKIEDAGGGREGRKEGKGDLNGGGVVMYARMSEGGEEGRGYSLIEI